MRTFTVISALIASIVIPSVAAAAPAAAQESPTGATGFVLAVTGLVTAIGAAVTAVRGRKTAQAASTRAAAAEQRAADADANAERATQRAARAMALAEAEANAMYDGVILRITAPGTVSPCVDVLDVADWTVRGRDLSQSEYAAAAGDPWALLGAADPDVRARLRADIEAADAVILEGYSVEAMDIIAACVDFRERIRSGASVILATGGHNFRYNLGPWGRFACTANMALTTEGMAVSSLVRRHRIAKLQGVRAGQLADARAKLLASGAS